jgi:hypothetical protein
MVGEAAGAQRFSLQRRPPAERWRVGTCPSWAPNYPARAWKLAERCSAAPAQALCPLVSCAAHRQPACGSRMTGDCHVRFCESRGGGSPRPLTTRGSIDPSVSAPLQDPLVAGLDSPEPVVTHPGQPGALREKRAVAWLVRDTDLHLAPNPHEVARVRSQGCSRAAVC